MFGTKGKMTEAYLGEARVVVTKINIPQLTITQVKNEDKDGYKAIQVVFGQPRKHTTKALKNHFKGLKEIPRNVREIKDFKAGFEPKVGDTLTTSDLLKVGDVVSIQGTTKGKGFTGVIKRWGFSRGPRTHGQSDRTRAPGSIGQGTTPGRVHKGKKMAGRLGSTHHTVKNAQVIHIDHKNNEIWVTGHVSGNQSGILTLTITGNKEVKNLVSHEIKTIEPKSDQSEAKKAAKPSKVKSEKTSESNSAKKETTSKEETTDTPTKKTKEEPKKESK